MKEIQWVQVNKVEGYEDVKPMYVICSDGRMINTDRLSYLKISLGSNGYPKYNLQTVDGKKNVYIHQILAKAFIPNPNNLPVVRHLDDNKMNWDLSNLVWGTVSDNAQDAIKNGRHNYGGAAADLVVKARNGAKTGAKNGAKLSKPVRCVETGEIYKSTHEASRVTGIGQSNISKCCLGKRKSAGKYHWEWYHPQQASANIVDMSDYLEINTSYRIN